MKPMTRFGGLAFVIAAVALALDQASKAWVVAAVRASGVGPAIPGPLHLTLVGNSGISYGLLQGGGDWTRWVLAAFALVVSLVLAAWAWRAEKLATAIGVGLILGGALGNVADRIAHGAVVDFIDARALDFPWIFNVADSAISVGIAILLLDGVLAPRRSAA
jgi:signal peptidase II